jgi:hypothetical protein
MRPHARLTMPDTSSRRLAPARDTAAFWQRGDGLRAVLRPPVLGSIGALVLLASFEHVVQQAVVDGALRRQADARHADASWRCRALVGADLSTRCLSALGPAR